MNAELRALLCSDKTVIWESLTRQAAYNFIHKWKEAIF